MSTGVPSRPALARRPCLRNLTGHREGTPSRRLNPRFHIHRFQAFLRIWIGALSGVVLSRLDQVIMTPLSSSYQLGLYAVAVSISDVTLILHSAMRDVIFATDASARDNERLCASTRISGLLSICLGTFLAVLVPFGIPVFFGQDFSPAIPSAFWLLAAVVLATPGSIAGAGLSARGRPGLRSLALAFAAVVNILALVVLVPLLGAVGAAIATLVGNLVASQINIISIVRVSGIRMREFYGIRRVDVAVIGQCVSSLGIPSRRTKTSNAVSTKDVGLSIEGRL